MKTLIALSICSCVVIARITHAGEAEDVQKVIEGLSTEYGVDCSALSRISKSDSPQLRILAASAYDMRSSGCQNQTAAIDLYLKLSDEGFPKAQSALCQIYSYRGNVENAVKWCSVAAENGDRTASKQLELLRKLGSPISRLQK